MKYLRKVELVFYKSTSSVGENRHGKNSRQELWRNRHGKNSRQELWRSFMTQI
jgi:hypothetical protein